MASIRNRVDELLAQGMDMGEAISIAVTEQNSRVDYFDAQRQAAGV
jgi:uncharacterized protein YoaH (UPF0181 family)